VGGDRLYTLREVAMLCRASLATVRYWVHTRRLESVRPGKQRLVTAEALSRFVNRHKRIAHE
jgi:excisionase family DNA binding protein